LYSANLKDLRCDASTVCSVICAASEATTLWLDKNKFVIVIIINQFLNCAELYYINIALLHTVYVCVYFL